MTPKEKAIYLYRNYLIFFPEFYSEKEYYYNEDKAKQCALIAVDEIIKETKLHDKTIYQHGRTFYWQEVKQEIEKL
jgi:hypothetical protein